MLHLCSSETPAPQTEPRGDRQHRGLAGTWEIVQTCVCAALPVVQKSPRPVRGSATCIFTERIVAHYLTLCPFLNLPILLTPLTKDCHALTASAALEAGPPPPFLDMLRTTDG